MNEPNGRYRQASSLEPHQTTSVLDTLKSAAAGAADAKQFMETARRNTRWMLLSRQGVAIFAPPVIIGLLAGILYAPSAPAKDLWLHVGVSAAVAELAFVVLLMAGFTVMCIRDVINGPSPKRGRLTQLWIGSPRRR